MVFWRRSWLLLRQMILQFWSGFFRIFALSAFDDHVAEVYDVLHPLLAIQHTTAPSGNRWGFAFRCASPQRHIVLSSFSTTLAGISGIAPWDDLYGVRPRCCLGPSGDPWSRGVTPRAEVVQEAG